MTKAEARKMARLEAENKALREALENVHRGQFSQIREAVAWRVAIDDISKTIAETREFLRP